MSNQEIWRLLIMIGAVVVGFFYGSLTLKLLLKKEMVYCRIMISGIVALCLIIWSLNWPPLTVIALMFSIIIGIAKQIRRI